MNKVLALVLALLSVGCGSSNSSLSQEDLFRIGARSAVRVLSLAGRPHGSGFITRSPAGANVVITNEHVCYGAREYRLLLEGFGATEIVAEPVLTDRVHDLCVFLLPKEVQGVVTPMRLAPSFLLRGPVFAIGYPLQYALSISGGFSLDYSRVKIASFGREDCEIKIPTLFGVLCVQEEDVVVTNTIIYPGNSGSMAVNSEGQVVGVFNSASQDTNYGNMISLEDLKEFLKQI